METARNTPERPFGVLLSSVVDGLRTLYRQHVELAKLEVTEAATVRARGAASMVAAAVVALYAVGFAAAAVTAALAIVLPTWAAIVIVTVLLSVATAILVVIGRRTIARAPKPELTQQTLKEDVRWAKRQLAR